MNDLQEFKFNLSWAKRRLAIIEENFKTEAYNLDFIMREGGGINNIHLPALLRNLHDLELQHNTLAGAIHMFQENVKNPLKNKVIPPKTDPVPEAEEFLFAIFKNENDFIRVVFTHKNVWRTTNSVPPKSVWKNNEKLMEILKAADLTYVDEDKKLVFFTPYL